MLSNETKIGLLTAISIVLLIWGYQFLKGKNILSSSQLFYVEYEDINRLKPSTPVVINGFQVGIVSDIYFTENMETIEVVLDVRDDISIPKNTIAQITSASIMGDKAITLLFDKPCKGNDCAQSGDRLKGTMKGLLGTMIGEPTEVDAYMGAVKNNLGDIVDTLKTKVMGEGGEGDATMDDLKVIIANLKSTTSQLDRLMAASSSKLTGVLGNMDALSANLKNSNAEITGIINNFNTFSAQLKDADVGKTLAKASTAMDGASDALTSMKTTLASADGAVKDLSAVLQKVNGTEGTLGMLMNDDKMYNDLERTIKNMDFLLQDIRLHPERYRRVLSKKKMPYEKIESDPAFQE